MLLDLHITAGRYTVVEAASEIDLASTSALRDCLNQTIHAGSRQPVVDLGQVGFMDWVGLGVPIGAHRRLLAHDYGSIQLVCSDQSVVRILRLTGLDRVLPLYVTLADVLGGDAGSRRRPVRPARRSSKPERA